uniref:Thioesterase domain-containing protein n=1 Tax=Manihot esculenta TaxID=3983 RepID=A0A2C9V385_MANES
MMFAKSLLSRTVPFARCFSWTAPSVLQTGDILRQTRVFSIEDVTAYSKPGAVYVSQILQFKSPVYIGEEVHGEVQALSIRENKRRYIAKFATKCFKKGELLIIDGEAMAILPTLAVENIY